MKISPWLMRVLAALMIFVGECVCQMCSVGSSAQELIGCVSNVMTSHVDSVLQQYDPLVVPNQLEKGSRWEAELTDIRLVGLSEFQPPAIAVTMPSNNRIQFGITVQWNRLTANMRARMVAGGWRVPLVVARPVLLLRQPHAQLSMTARLDTQGVAVEPIIEHVKISFHLDDIHVNVWPRGLWGVINGLMLFPAGRSVTHFFNIVWKNSQPEIERSMEKLVEKIATNALKTAFP